MAVSIRALPFGVYARAAGAPGFWKLRSVTVVKLPVLVYIVQSAPYRRSAQWSEARSS